MFIQPIVRSGTAGAALAALAVAVCTTDVGALPPGYTVPAGVSVVQIVADGGRGGNTDNYSGGAGCRVTVSLEVTEGDEFTWTVGGNGGDVTYGATAQSGAAGGTGTYPGGDGGDTPGAGTPGAGGGAATTVLFNGDETIVAAGGGGATYSTGGGAGCGGYSAAGGDGYGSWSTRALGASDPFVGGTGASTQYATPGSNGNSSTDIPAGRGGDGADGQSDGASAGPGGGGGVSGGGGGDGQVNQYSPGGLGSAAAGLSLAPDAPTGIVYTQYFPNPGTDGAYPGGVSVNVVTIELDVPSASIDIPYTGRVTGTFAGTEEVTGYIAHYSVTPDLPAGLTMDPATGDITGTPTAPSTPTTYTVTVRRTVSTEPSDPGEDSVNATGATVDVIAASSATFTLGVDDGASGPGTIPVVGSTEQLVGVAGAAAVLLSAGAALVALVARSRRRSLA